MNETIIVTAIVVLIIGLGIRKYYRIFTGKRSGCSCGEKKQCFINKESGCGCGCSSCSVNSENKDEA